MEFIAFMIFTAFFLLLAWEAVSVLIEKFIAVFDDDEHISEDEMSEWDK